MIVLQAVSFRKGFRYCFFVEFVTVFVKVRDTFREILFEHRQITGMRTHIETNRATPCHQVLVVILVHFFAWHTQPTSRGTAETTGHVAVRMELPITHPVHVEHFLRMVVRHHVLEVQLALIERFNVNFVSVAHLGALSFSVGGPW